MSKQTTTHEKTITFIVSAAYGRRRNHVETT